MKLFASILNLVKSFSFFSYNLRENETTQAVLFHTGVFGVMKLFVCGCSTW